MNAHSPSADDALRPAVPRDAMLARRAVSLIFFLNGASFCAILPRYPELVESIGLSNTAFGLAVGLGPLGGLLAGLFAARLMSRFGSARTSVAFQLLASTSHLAIYVSGSWLWLTAALLLAQAADALTDISMNAHGMRVERRYRRSIMNSYHGWWSLGAVLGGLLGAAAAQVGLPLWAQGVAGLIVFGALVLGSYRFLLPGELEGSPALTFAPMLPPGQTTGEGRPGPVWREFQRRFDAYKARVVRPFFRDHFARIDRQVVLTDVLGAIHAGPPAVDDMRRAMADILSAFRPGRAGWLAQILGTRRVERILFAATKADHLHHVQHQRLANILTAMLREARDRADFQGARTEAMAIAALRTTTEETIHQGGQDLPAVRGTLMDGREAALYPGELPDNPAALIDPARRGADRWLDADYAIMNFAPAPATLRPGDGPPHIRMDRAAEFLIGDRL